MRLNNQYATRVAIIPIYEQFVCISARGERKGFCHPPKPVKFFLKIICVSKCLSVHHEGICVHEKFPPALARGNLFKNRVYEWVVILCHSNSSIKRGRKFRRNICPFTRSVTGAGNWTRTGSRTK